MDASIRDREVAAAVKVEEPRQVGRCHACPDRSGLRVALAHDWLTGMRGGEKCLEVLCRVFPHATLYTLLHRPGSTSPAIESMAIGLRRSSRCPGSFATTGTFFRSCRWRRGRGSRETSTWSSA